MRLPNKASCLFLLSLFSASGYTEEEMVNNPIDTSELALSTYVLTRTDALPPEHFENVTDSYLEGYVQALIDIHYSEFGVQVSVRNHKVYLSNLPKNQLTAKSLIAFVEDIPTVVSVEVEKSAVETKDEQEISANRPKVNGIWFPESTVLFAPLVADPRQPTNFVAFRGNDRVIGRQVASVAIGDDFPIFRWKDLFLDGDLQIGISAGIWAVFNYSHIPHKKPGESCELVNTDYFVGIPLTYASGKWSFRLRPYHISGHLGDEFLCNRSHGNHPLERKNPSYEAIDFFGNYQITSGLRVYGGPGVVVHSDRSFKLKPLYVQYGAEFRFLGTKFDYHGLYGTWFLAAHIENWQQRFWHFDETVKFGYEFSKLQGVGRKMRLYTDYHQGYSYEGQFFNDRTSYYEVGFSWDF